MNNQILSGDGKTVEELAKDYANNGDYDEWLKVDHPESRYEATMRNFTSGYATGHGSRDAEINKAVALLRELTWWWEDLNQNITEGIPLFNRIYELLKTYDQQSKNLNNGD